MYNCYKVIIDGEFVAVFSTEQQADFYVACMLDIMWGKHDYRIVPAYIEGIGF